MEPRLLLGKKLGLSGRLEPEELAFKLAMTSW